MCSPLIAEYRLQPTQPRKLTRALLIVALEQKHSVAFPICRAKPVAPSEQGIQYILFPNSSPCSPWIPFCCLTRTRTLPTAEYSNPAQWSQKPDQRTWATAEPILYPPLGRKLRQESYPTVHSQRHTLSPLASGSYLTQNQILISSPTCSKTLSVDTSRNQN